MVVSRSCQPSRYIRRWISRKPLQIEAWFQGITNRKWHMGYQMVTWPMTSRDPKGAVRQYGRLSYSDSLASCYNSHLPSIVSCVYFVCLICVWGSIFCGMQLYVICVVSCSIETASVRLFAILFLGAANRKRRQLEGTFVRPLCEKWPLSVKKFYT